MSERLLGGISSRYIDTPRLRTHLLESGVTSKEKPPVLFVHGNVSSSRFFEETLRMLACCPPGYRGLAPDLRGFGRSDDQPVDATRGLKDFSDDLKELITALEYGDDQKIHLVGWSLGGGIAIQYAIDHPTEIASITLIAPMPPYGVLGTKDTTGTPCWPDFAGSGGGMAVAEFVKRLKQDDKSADNPFSPRNRMNSVYFKSPFRVAPEREEVFVSEILRMEVGDGNYPGDKTESQNWPGFGAPGTRGILNAISPKYCNLSAFSEIDPKPPVLWIRGSADTVISNDSMDAGRLGRLGTIPGWPGEEIFPPQPMISQLYAVLDRYGKYQEVLLDCGHSPHIEKPEAFRQEFLRFIASADEEKAQLMRATDTVSATEFSALTAP